MDHTTLLVIAFVIKILSRNHLFSYIKEKHGNLQLRLCRVYERTCIRHEKVRHDLDFLLKCKKEHLTPKFAKPKLAVKENGKLKIGIARLIVKAEITNKHNIRNDLRKEMRKQNMEIQKGLSFPLFNALRYKIRININIKKKRWEMIHEKKLKVLRGKTVLFDTNSIFVKNIIHNFSDYTLSAREIEVLSLSLDHCVPLKNDEKRLQTEFERFYQDISVHTTRLEERDKLNLKTEFLDTLIPSFRKLNVRPKTKKLSLT